MPLICESLLPPTPLKGFIRQIFFERSCHFKEMELLFKYLTKLFFKEILKFRNLKTTQIVN